MKGGLKIMKNKKGNVATWVFIGLILVIALVAGGFWWNSQSTPGETAVTAAAVSGIAKVGNVASIKVFVRDVAQNDINTKLAVATYCQANTGEFIIDATSSSTSAEITGQTTIGKVITCWAFNSTVQTMTPVTITVNAEVEHIVIDAYQVPTSSEMTIFDSSLNSANTGTVNLSVGADGSDSFSKMKFKNDNTNKWIPLGGFFYDVVEDTNVSDVDMSGSVVLFGFGSEAIPTTISRNTENTAVNDRKSKWDYVFGMSDNANGQNALIIEQNDYIETSPITISSSVGCSGNLGGRLIIKAYTNGYFRETKNTGVAYGFENDASTASVITADHTGATVYCSP